MVDMINSWRKVSIEKEKIKSYDLNNGESRNIKAIKVIKKIGAKRSFFT